MGLCLIKAIKDGIMSKFWSTVQSFLPNKCCISNDFISAKKDDYLSFLWMPLLFLFILTKAESNC